MAAADGSASVEGRRRPARVAVVGAGAWGTTLAAILAQREPVTLLCHSPETADAHPRRPAERGASAGHRPAGEPRAPRPTRRRSAARPTSWSSPSRPRTSASTVDAVAASSRRPRTCCRSSRASSAGRTPDDRGHRRAGGIDARRIAALSGPNLALEIAREPARVGRRRRRGRRRSPRAIAGAPGPARVPAVREPRRARRRAVRRAQERRRDRRGRGRGARVRRQRQGRAHDPRSRRDDAAGHRRRREPAHVRRAGGHRRRHRHVRLAAVAQPSARRGARARPTVGGDRGHAAGRRRGRLHRRRGPRARRRAWASRCRSRARSTRAVRGQERPALPDRPARPRVEGRARRLRPLGGADGSRRSSSTD